MEVLTLATPVTYPSTTTWRIKRFDCDIDAPYIKVILVSNKNEFYTYQKLANDAASASQINNALSFINQGKFMTLQGKSLQKWLFERIQADDPNFAGTISGTPD